MTIMCITHFCGSDNIIILGIVRIEKKARKREKESKKKVYYVIAKKI